MRKNLPSAVFHLLYTMRQGKGVAVGERTRRHHSPLPRMHIRQMLPPVVTTTTIKMKNFDCFKMIYFQFASMYFFPFSPICPFKAIHLSQVCGWKIQQLEGLIVTQTKIKVKIQCGRMRVCKSAELAFHTQKDVLMHMRPQFFTIIVKNWGRMCTLSEYILRCPSN